MTSGVVALALLGCFTNPNLSVQATPCAALAQELREALAASVMAMEPEGARRAVYDRATEAAGRCPADERLAYLRLRAVELGAEAPLDDHDNDAKRAAPTKLARELTRQFPRSAAIATVAARCEGTVEAARKAVALDAAYPPAQVALAAALLDAGDAAAARTVIDAVKELGGLDDGYAVLARIEWAQGDSAGAMAAANKELKGRQAFGLEPGGGDLRGLAEAHEVLGRAYIQRRQLDRAAPHLLAAESLSQRVQALLASADPALARAVAKARRAASAGRR
jgi:tetratricopeptide (TPR) repeat protein